MFTDGLYIYCINGRVSKYLNTRIFSRERVTVMKTDTGHMYRQHNLELH